MEEILGRLRSYGTLQPDSLEAMRNEYVVALLHASIHIVMDCVLSYIFYFVHYDLIKIICQIHQRCLDMEVSIHEYIFL